MNLIFAGGPYYIMGFVITFFTLMGSRYLLAEDIYPQEKFARIIMISLAWLPSLIGVTAIAYFRRGTKLEEAEVKLADLEAKLAEKDPELKEAEDVMNGETESTPKEKKKDFLNW